jgi:hypothetical protein
MSSQSWALTELAQLAQLIFDILPFIASAHARRERLSFSSGDAGPWCRSASITGFATPAPWIAGPEKLRGNSSRQALNFGNRFGTTMGQTQLDGFVSEKWRR